MISLATVRLVLAVIELDGGPMSALGHKQTFALQALPPIADICGANWDVRYGHKRTSASFDRLLADAACVRDQAVQARGAVPHWKSASSR